MSALPPAQAGGLPALAATVRIELLLRLRDPALPVLLAFLLAACALLVPSPEAPYAILTLDGKKPLMSAETALVAAAVVFGLLVLPVYSLLLGVGHARDRRLHVDRLHLTLPGNGAALIGGRLLAGLVFVLLSTLLSLLAVLSTILARYGGLAPASAVALFFLAVLPVGLFAVAASAILDRCLPERSGVRAALVFGLWFALMALSAMAQWDLFGIRYLAQATATGDARPSLSIGVIAGQAMPAVPWIHAPLTPGFVPFRLSLILGLVGALIPLAFLLSPSPRSVAAAGGHGTGASMPPAASRVLAQLPSVRLPTASAWVTVRAIAARWRGRARLIWALMALALALALSTAAPGAALAVAHTVLMAVVSRISQREQQVAATLERTTAAFLRPSPSLLHGGVLALMAAVPALPAFVRMAPVQALTASAGLLAASLWLTWTHRCVQRPLLGISTFSLLWYIDVFNDVPSVVDVLGLWHPGARTLTITGVAAGALLMLVERHDRRGRRRDGGVRPLQRKPAAPS
jgi:hypothetical protein